MCAWPSLVCLVARGAGQRAASDAAPARPDFADPARVTILGYSDHAMESFISRDGRYVAGDDDLVRKLGELARVLVPGTSGLERSDTIDEHSSKPTSQIVVIEEGLPGHTLVSELSAGTQQLLLLALLYLRPRPLILLEEPDSSVHVGALPALRDLLQSISRSSTVIATSHSPAFVGLLDPGHQVIALDRIGADVRAMPLAEALRSRRWLGSFSGDEAFIRAGSERKR